MTSAAFESESISFFNWRIRVEADLGLAIADTPGAAFLGLAFFAADFLGAMLDILISYAGETDRHLCG
jgi:hypothetical protein